MFLEEGENECVRKINLLCVKKCGSWKPMVCKQNNMCKKVVIVGVHGIIFMNKPLNILLK